MQALLFAVNTVFPVFLLISLGIFLKRVKAIDDGFVKKASLLVFRCSLPALIFEKVSSVDFSSGVPIKVVTIATMGVILFPLFVSVIIPLLRIPRSQRGVLTIASFWSNTAIMGLSLVENALGAEAFSEGALITAFLIPVYNILSVVILGIYAPAGKKVSVKDIVQRVGKNPILLSLLVALVFNALSLSLPSALATGVGYLSRMALPLALISTGAALSFHGFQKRVIIGIWGIIFKLIINPLSIIFALYWAGVDGSVLVIVFLLCGSPTAVSSFPLSVAMENDGETAATLLIMTTLFSFVTLAAGLYIMKSLGVV